jgi:predicted 3-demethylubiquinone-9 3-methyltransferase (glyoxalase superfamily)
MQKLTTFLMFVGEQHGRAEEAMKFYVSVFDNSKIVYIERYGADGEEPQGTVKHASFLLGGQEFMAIDSAGPHHFTFTPAISVFVRCNTVAEVDTLFERLSEGGAILMELDKYPFSERFGWVQDRFGVSWQLILAESK